MHKFVIFRTTGICVHHINNKCMLTFSKATWYRQTLKWLTVTEGWWKSFIEIRKVEFTFICGLFDQSWEPSNFNLIFSQTKLNQGGHIFEKLNSSSFPWVFQDILNLFPEQLERKKFDECIFVSDHVTYVSFSLSFPGFFYRSSNFPEFSLRFWQFCKFPEFSRFSMFSRFVATL